MGRMKNMVYLATLLIALTACGRDSNDDSGSSDVGTTCDEQNQELFGCFAESLVERNQCWSSLAVSDDFWDYFVIPFIIPAYRGEGEISEEFQDCWSAQVEQSRGCVNASVPDTDVCDDLFEESYVSCVIGFFETVDDCVTSGLVIAGAVGCEEDNGECIGNTVHTCFLEVLEDIESCLDEADAVEEVCLIDTTEAECVED
jgi:hypothetical protein